MYCEIMAHIGRLQCSSKQNVIIQCGLCTEYYFVTLENTVLAFQVCFRNSPSIIADDILLVISIVVHLLYYISIYLSFRHRNELFI
jgi:hypothetical protein